MTKMTRIFWLALLFPSPAFASFNQGGLVEVVVVMMAGVFFLALNLVICIGVYFG